MSVNRFSEIAALPQYIDPFDVNAFARIATQRQLEFDAGVQQSNTIIDATNNLNIINPEAKAYANEKLKALNESVNGLKNADFSDPRNVRKVKSTMSSIYNDPIVAKALVSSKNAANAELLVQDIIKSGQGAPSNIREITRAIEEYRNGSKDGYLPSQQYKPYVDIYGNIKKELDTLKPDDVVEYQIQTSSGIENVRIKRALLTPERIAEYVKYRISNDPKYAEQAAIDFRYDFEINGKNPAKYLSSHVTSKIMDYNIGIGRLTKLAGQKNALYKELEKANPEQKAQLKTQLESLDETITSMGSTLNQMKKYTNFNPNNPTEIQEMLQEVSDPSAAYQAYMGSVITGLTKLAYNKEIENKFFTNTERKLYAELQKQKELESYKSQLEREEIQLQASLNPKRDGSSTDPSSPGVGFDNNSIAEIVPTVGDKSNRVTTSGLADGAKSESLQKQQSAFDALMDFYHHSNSNVATVLFGNDEDALNGTNAKENMRILRNEIEKKISNKQYKEISDAELNWYTQVKNAEDQEKDITEFQTKTIKKVANSPAYLKVTEEEKAEDAKVQELDKDGVFIKFKGGLEKDLTLSPSEYDQMVKKSLNKEFVYKNGNAYFISNDPLFVKINNYLERQYNKGIGFQEKDQDSSLGNFSTEPFSKVLAGGNSDNIVAWNKSGKVSRFDPINNDGEINRFLYIYSNRANTNSKKRKFLDESGLVSDNLVNMPKIVFKEDEKLQNNLKPVAKSLLDTYGISANVQDVVSIEPASLVTAGGSGSLTPSKIKITYTTKDKAETKTATVAVDASFWPTAKQMLGDVANYKTEQYVRNKGNAMLRNKESALPFEVKGIFDRKVITHKDNDASLIETTVEYSPKTQQFIPVFYVNGSRIPVNNVQILENLKSANIRQAKAKIDFYLKMPDFVKAITNKN